MKKVFEFSGIVFWMSFFLFIIILVGKYEQDTDANKQAKVLKAMEIANKEEIESGKQVIMIIKDREGITLLLGSLGILMAISFIAMESSSEPKPKIKLGRPYRLENIIPVKGRGCTIVLSHKNKVETYKSLDDEIEIYRNLNISAALTPVIGKDYLIRIKKNEMVFIEW